MASDAIRNEAMLRADVDAAAENSPSRCSKPSVVRNIICVYLDPFVKKNEYKYSRLFRFFKHIEPTQFASDTAPEKCMHADFVILHPGYFSYLFDLAFSGRIPAQLYDQINA